MLRGHRYCAVTAVTSPGVTAPVLGSSLSAQTLWSLNDCEPDWYRADEQQVPEALPGSWIQLAHQRSPSLQQSTAARTKPMVLSWRGCLTTCTTG
jgi:hypothetical protein